MTVREERSKPIEVQAMVPLLELANRIGHVYGSEDLAMLFYSLVRRERPVNIVELGTGLGVTAFWMAQAVKENGLGRVWTIDDASHWQSQEQFNVAIGPLLEVPPFDAFDPADLTYPTFVQNTIDLLGLSGQMRFLQMQIDMTKEADFTVERYGFLEAPIDFLFLDIARTPDDILDTLALFLPHMSDCASIMIDSASTSLTSYLFLEKLVDQLNHSKVPRRFLLNASEEKRRTFGDLVAQRRFTLLHLIERVKRAQNSTAWLRMEPNDYVPHPQTLMKWV